MKRDNSESCGMLSQENIKTVPVSWAAKDSMTYAFDDWNNTYMV